MERRKKNRKQINNKYLINNILYGLLIVLLPIKSFSQETVDTTKITRINKQYFKTYITDTKDILISPIHWNKYQFLGFGLFAGATYIIHTQDLKIHNFAQSKRTSLTNNISKYGLEPIGSGIYSMSGFALLGLHGIIFKNNRSLNTALLGAKTYLITGLVVTIPKILINRHRPYHDTPANPNIFVGPSIKLYESFPSGHTTSAFALATIIASEYNNNLFIPITAYSIAGLVGLSRINDNKHWASDVLAGAVFGWAMGKFLYKINKKNILISPYKNQNSTGITLSLKLSNNDN